MTSERNRPGVNTNDPDKVIRVRPFREKYQNPKYEGLSYAIRSEFNASIWVSGDDGSEIRNRLYDLLDSEEIEFSVEEGPPVAGSWWQKIKLQISYVWNAQIIQHRAPELERRLQLELVEKRSAEVDSIKADAAAKLLAAIDKQEQAVVVFGQIVIVKTRGTIVVKSISAVTAGRLEKDPVLLTDPEAVLAVLAGPDQQRRSALAETTTVGEHTASE